MDKFQALQTFWESFGIPAYDENTLPTGDDAPAFPYITYDAVVSNLGYPVAMSASIWDYSTSWSRVTTKMTEIQSAIGRGGKILPIDDGAIWITAGTPFAQRMSDSNDMIRRIFINISAEYLTAE